ncbi:MAG: DHH family phosphoesterase [Treponema sp.]
MRVVPQGLIDFINKYSTIVIAGHKEPDGDCIGSSLALSLFLKRRGKKTILLSAGPFKRTEIMQYESLFTNTLPQEYKTNAGAIIVDCSNIERTGSIEEEIKDLPIAIIDHHATNKEESPTFFIDGTSPAACLLVQDVIEKMAGSLTKEEAFFVLFGICTDTGFFRHLDEKSSETFLYVSRLVSTGVSPKLIFAQMNGNKSFASRILIGRSLERLTLHYNDSLAITYQTLEDFLEFGLNGRDTDTLYMLLQAIKDVQAIVVIKQEDENHCSIGFRSFDKIDVSIVAAKFNGGGHKQASGAYIEGTYKELIPKIIDEFSEQMKKGNS